MCDLCSNDTATTEIYTYRHTLSRHDGSSDLPRPLLQRGGEAARQVRQMGAFGLQFQFGRGIADHAHVIAQMMGEAMTAAVLDKGDKGVEIGRIEGGLLDCRLLDCCLLDCGRRCDGSRRALCRLRAGLLRRLIIAEFG